VVKGKFPGCDSEYRSRTLGRGERWLTYFGGGVGQAVEDLDCRDISWFGATFDGYLFNVVDLPDDGLPTRPMRGSRGILGVWRGA